MKTVLVTGATGFVGANLSRVLIERGIHVRALVRPSSTLSNLKGVDLEIAYGDLRDPDAVSNAVRGVDEVFHTAAEYQFWSKDPQAIYASNVQGTRNVMESSLRHGVQKVVYTSTVGTIGLANQPLACNENTPAAEGQFGGHYKKSKLEAEKLVLDYASRGLPVVIVNPSAPVGAWDRKPTPTGKIIVDFVNGKIPAYVATGLNLVHVRDVAIGHLLAAEKGKVGERYILGNENLSLENIFSLLSSITGKSSPKLRIPYGAAWLVGCVSTKFSDWVTHRPPAVALEAVKMAQRYMYFDISKSIQELGVPLTPVKDALKESVDWFAKNNYFDRSRFKKEEIKWLYQ